MQLTVVGSVSSNNSAWPVVTDEGGTMGLTRIDVGSLEVEVTHEEILADLLYPADDVPAAARGRAAADQPARSRASLTSRRTPNPLAPLPTYSRPTSQAVPAMSRWTQGRPSTNSSRNEAA